MNSQTMSVVDLKKMVERNPYGMVAGALGLGFVLGGGLFTRLTAHVVGAGLRIGLMAALPLLQKELERRSSEGSGAPAAVEGTGHVRG